MNGTFSASMGDRGRLVIPLELRTSAGLTEGTPLVLVAAENGIVVMTRDQARSHLRRQLAGRDLVADLLADRRRTANAEDAA